MLEDSSWTYADLRVLDPPDAPNPTQDIIAPMYASLTRQPASEGLFGLRQNRIAGRNPDPPRPPWIWIYERR